MTSGRVSVLSSSKLHVYVLWSFAVAQPLLDIVSKNAELLVAQHINTSDIVVLLFFLCLLFPTLFLLPGLLIGLLSRRASERYFLLVIAVLIFLIALQISANAFNSQSYFVIPGALLLGLALTIAYFRSNPVKSFCGYMAPAILVFPLVFVFNSDVSRTANGTTAFISHPADSSRNIPIVMVVFDELPILSLLDESTAIDSVRYPNFAALAADSHWFRNARTVSGTTTVAVPALLSGQLVEDAVPVVANYPRNLFTLFGATHELFVNEQLTMLCPYARCLPQRVDALLSQTRKLAGFFSDMGIVYLHLLSPEHLRGKLPAISQSWSNFGDQNSGAAAPGAPPSIPRRAIRQDQVFAEFVDSITDGAKPRLYYLHILLPHVPWEYLPSGRRYYSLGETEIPGLDIVKERWSKNRALVEQGYYRHLMQVGFVDGLLGQLIAKLRSEGMYEKSLLIIASDHGVNFWPGKSRRAALRDPGRAMDVPGIVLFIKTPDQHHGLIHDAPVLSIDVLPTIENILGYSQQFDYPGQALLQTGEQGTTEQPNPYLGYEGLQRKLALFGSGNREGTYYSGGFPQLIGRHTDTLNLDTSGELRFVQDWNAGLQNFKSSDSYILASLTGKIVGDVDTLPDLPLAVALNSKIVAVTRSYTAAEEKRFSVMLPESAFIDGKNTVELFRIRENADAGLSLEQISGSASPLYQYTPAGNLTRVGETGWRKGEVILKDGLVTGYIERVRPDGESLLITGWAVDTKNSRPADFLLLDINGSLSYLGSPHLTREDVATYFKDPALAISGFDLRFRIENRDTDRTPTVRLIAVSGEKASVLAVDFDIGAHINKPR